MNTKNLHFSFWIVIFFILSCSNNEFQLKGSLIESQYVKMYFDSDSTLLMIRKEYIGGETVPIKMSDSLLYLNYNQVNEKIMTYTNIGDSIIFKNQDSNDKENLKFIKRKIDDNSLFEFNRQFNLHKRLGLVPGKIELNPFDSLDLSESHKIIKVLSRRIRRKLKYPDSAKMINLYAYQIEPKNEVDLLWYDNSLFDDYKFYVEFKAKNALGWSREVDYSGFVQIENKKMSKVILKDDSDAKKYDFTRHLVPEDFKEDDIKKLIKAIREKLGLSIEKDVYKLILYSERGKEGSYILYLFQYLDENDSPSTYLKEEDDYKVRIFKLFKKGDIFQIIKY